MEVILLKKARIYDIRSAYHLKQVDVLIEKGKITALGRSVKTPKKAKVIESRELSISPGWLDIGCYNGEPGFEYREDLDSLRAAAMQGGYCHLAPLPTGHPAMDNRGQLLYLSAQTKDHIVDISLIAALTKNRAGKEISELLDLHHAGAIAFSDGDTIHLSEAQLMRSLLYLKGIDALTIYNATDMADGALHEGRVSVQMGLQGAPPHREETKVAKAIHHSEYAEARILIHNVSTAKSIKMIKNSSDGDRISASVSFLNLIREDTDVLDFDLNLKVSPPLRDKSERKALSKAVANGVVNVITSNHRPLSIEEKDQPFGLSKFGASTLDTVFQALNTFGEGLPLERIIHCLSVGPHELLRLNCPIIEKGQKAVLTCFDPTVEVLFEAHHLMSKSKNNPFVNVPMKGSILGIINSTKSNFDK